MTKAENKELTTLAPLAGRLPPPLGSDLRSWEEWQAYCPGKHPARTACVQPEKSARMGRSICRMAFAYRPAAVATKCSLLKRSCHKRFLQKQVKQIVQTCSTWVEVL